VDASDVVDGMQADWRSLQPGLDVTSMGVIHRILRASRFILEQSDAFLAGYGLTRGELDVLSAMRRSPTPLTPTELAGMLLVPPSAITMRLKALEKRDLLDRFPNPSDAVIPAQLTLEDSLLERVKAEDVEQLADRLRSLVGRWEQERPPPNTRPG
jgi:DNA-binding MarR family transcriptional regulator